MDIRPCGSTPPYCFPLREATFWLHGLLQDASTPIVDRTYQKNKKGGLSMLRRAAIVVVFVGVLPLLGTICIAWCNDHPTTFVGLVQSVCYWQAFQWAGSLLMAYMLTLVFLVRTGRLMVVAGDCDEVSDVAGYTIGSDVGIHPVTGNMTLNGFDVVTGYSTANYPSSTFD